MSSWFSSFKEDDSTLILNGEEYPKKDCVLLAHGSQKHVYLLKSTGLCFFIATRYSEATWNGMVKEKERLDYIIALGLKAQQFDTATLEIRDKQGNSHVINVLVAKSFEKLAQEEQSIIYNPKPGRMDFAPVPGVIGAVPSFFASIEEQLENMECAKHMLSRIVIEYVIAHTFSVPGVAYYADDAVHYSFDLSATSDLNPSPIIHYMFWDINSDSAELPHLPTLAQLKNKEKLREFANQIAIAICSVIEAQEKQHDKPWPFHYFNTHRENISGLILTSLKDSMLLKEALKIAKERAQNHLCELTKNPNFKNKVQNNKQIFLKLINSAISINDLTFLKECLDLDFNHTILTARDIENIIAQMDPKHSMMNHMKGVEDIYRQTEEHLKRQAQEEAARIEAEKQARLKTKETHLKTQFVEAYNTQLKIDQDKGFGLYGFFCHDYKPETRSLHDIVHHAQTGKPEQRSRIVMENLKWLDKSGQMTGELRRFYNENLEQSHYPHYSRFSQSY